MPEARGADVGPVRGGTPAGTGGPDVEVQRELRRMVLLNRSTFPLGALACTVTLVLLARPYLDGGRLALWTLSGLACAALFAVALWPPMVHRSDRTGLPVLLPAAGYVCGVVFGLLPWLDLDALHRTPFRWVALVILMAVSSGTQSGLVNGTPHLVRVLVPVWVLAGAAYAVIGDWVVAGASAVYLAIVVRDAVTSRGFVLAGVTARVQAHRRSVTDPLTGLPNRAGALAELERLASVHRGADLDVAALFVDLDGFKQVNDTFGHQVGDRLLTRAAERLTGCCRAQDHVSRLGGDEFLVLLVLGPDDPVDVPALCARLIATIEEPYVFEDARAQVSASIGVALSPAAALDPEDLVGRADSALYRAKRTGRRRTVLDAG